MKKEINAVDILNRALNEPGKLLEAYNAFYNFSFFNQILACIQLEEKGLKPSPIKTYKQWQEIGRQVKKGEKALTLCMPKKKTKIETDEKGEEVKTQYLSGYMFKNYWFSLEQTAGEAMPEINLPDWNKEKALKNLNIKLIDFEMINGNCQGYATKKNEIAINPLAQCPLKTLFHELAHIVLGHTKQEISTHAGTLPRNIKEMEAESTAYLCLETLGLKGGEYCRGYIQNWAENETITDKMAQRIMKATDEIIKAGGNYGK